MAEHLRAFIAIELPAEARELMAGVQSTLRRSPAASWVRWVEPEGIHLTLKFLGNIDADQVDAVAAAVEASSAGLASFSLAMGELGMFPRPTAPRVVWMGVSGHLDRLGQLQMTIERGLGSLGFTSESRLFTPHLTLGRVREGAPSDVLRTLGQLVTRIRPPGSVTIPVSQVTLFRSRLTPGGAIYTPLAKVALRGN